MLSFKQFIRRQKRLAAKKQAEARDRPFAGDTHPTHRMNLRTCLAMMNLGLFRTLLANQNDLSCSLTALVTLVLFRST